MSAEQFKRGEILIIRPSDTDDPKATQHQGERCRFLKYDHAGNCSVDLDGHLTYFRPTDLRKKDA